MKTELLHPHTRQQLELALQNPTHAYLLVGPRGSAKHQAARWFAAKLLGKELQAEQINHPNFLEVIRPAKKKTIGIDQIKQLVHSLTISSYDHTKPKVVVIDHIENLSAEASNSLLKALEEPPSYTVFVLTTSQIGAILPTVISRTQLVWFLLPSTDQLQKAFALDYQPEQINEALTLSEGLPARTHKFLAEPELLEKKEAFVEQAGNFVAGSITQRFAIAKAIYEAETTSELLEALIYTFRVKFSILETAQNLKSTMNAQKSIQHNVNPRLVIENLALEIV